MKPDDVMATAAATFDADNQLLQDHDPTKAGMYNIIQLRFSLVQGMDVNETRSRLLAFCMQNSVFAWTHIFMCCGQLTTFLQLSYHVLCTCTSYRVKSMEGILEVGSSGQCPPGGRPQNLATWFHPPTTTVVSPEPFPHQSRALRSLLKDLASYRH